MFNEYFSTVYELANGSELLFHDSISDVLGFVLLNVPDVYSILRELYDRFTLLRKGYI